MKTKTKTSVRFDDVAETYKYLLEPPQSAIFSQSYTHLYCSAIGNFDPLMREDWNRGLTYLMIMKFLRNLNRDFHA
ncbi:hypothetical protein QYF36_015071 [Acer negundo]|nr:hypothetical protein QYF36_015071 [Acer negundo]